VPLRRNPEPGSPRQPGLGKQIALDVARGLEFLHTQHIVHLDLKSPNGAALPCCALLCSAFIGIVGGGRNSRTAMGAKCFLAAAGALQRCAARKGRPVQGVLKFFNN